MWAGPAGYSSIAGIPHEDSDGDVGVEEASIAIAYNRGFDGDGCVGDACPYSTIISFAMIPIVPMHQSDAPIVRREGASVGVGRSEWAGDNAPAASVPMSPYTPIYQGPPSTPKLLGMGWWCGRTSAPPDSPNLFESVDLVLTTIAPPNCTTISTSVRPHSVNNSKLTIRSEA